jgi:hypothetical protein
MDKSFANGNSPESGTRPPQASAVSTTSWDLVLGVRPGVFAA